MCFLLKPHISLPNKTPPTDTEEAEVLIRNTTSPAYIPRCPHDSNTCEGSDAGGDYKGAAVMLISGGTLTMDVFESVSLLTAALLCITLYIPPWTTPEPTLPAPSR